MDVASIIQALLTDKWSSVIVELGDITFRKDEFDPKSPTLQILLENFPAKSTWIISGLYRVEHRLRITLYHKLIHYKPDDVIEYRERWFGCKSEIDKILIKSKFALASSGISNIINGSWEDDIPSIAVGRGVKTIREPIIWQSEQIITLVYYNLEELLEE